MTSWKPWFARTQSRVSAPAVVARPRRARSACVAVLNASSARSSSSSSASVIFVRGELRRQRLELGADEERLAQLLARRSSARGRRGSGTNETSPSAASRRSASRTGVRLTSNRSESCSWRSTVPGLELAGDDRLLEHERDLVGLRASRCVIASRSYAGSVRNSTKLVGQRDLGEHLLRLLAPPRPASISLEDSLRGEACRGAPTARAASGRSPRSRRPPSGCRSPPRRRRAATRRGSRRRRGRSPRRLRR